MFSSSNSSNSSNSSSILNFGSRGGDDSDRWERVKQHLSTITECDRAIGILYLCAFLFVLILTGNIIQRASKKKDMGWLAYSICVIAGLGGMFLIFTGKHAKMIGIIIINLLIAGLLMFAMIYIDPDAPMTEKIGAHSANILFLIASITAVSMTRNIEKQGTTES